MEIKKLQPGDEELFKQLVDLYTDVFETDNYEAPHLPHLTSLLHNWQQFYLVAYNGSDILDGLTAYILPSSYRPVSELYLYDIAVKRQHQRMGVGTLLVEALFRECERLEITEVFTQAENMDKHALAFYRKLGGHEKPGITHFSYPIAIHV